MGPRESQLTQRKAAILEALVRHHIRTGEAVGSEALAGATGLGVSPATIRNELAALEELGYLTQPHTSAGRIPTDLAYRRYVDSLPSRRLREGERRAIVEFFDRALADVDEILRGTTLLLARLTRHASLALAPSPREGRVARAELVSLGSATLLLIVFDTGRVEKRMVELPPGLRPDQEAELSRFVTERGTGASLRELHDAVRGRAAQPPRPLRDAFERVGGALEAIREAGEGEHVFVGGAANIVTDREFRERQTIQEILEALERETEILHLLREAAATPLVSVTIGQENPVTGIWEASVVAAPFGPGGAAGTIGVVGPTRMDYAATISAVRAVSERLSAAVEALGA